MLQQHSMLRARLTRYRGLPAFAVMLFAGASLVTTAAALAAAPCTGPGGPDDDADPMRDGCSDPRQSAAVVRHQLG